MDFNFPENPDEICKTLYNSETFFSRCVGYCNFHKAYITSHQVKTKHCLKKQCDAFIKNPSHEFWIQKEMKKAERKRRKEDSVSNLHLVQFAKFSPPPEKKKRYIVIDLEMCELVGKERKDAKGLSEEVIQIGAVMLDEKFNCISEFSSLVKPIYASISEEISSLTGITNENVENADIFTVAFRKFYTWVGNDDITTLCWSDSDYKQLWDEIYVKAKNHDEYRLFLKTFVDLQDIFGRILSSESAISLDVALKFCHLKFKGQRHTARADAFNTARIFCKLMRQKKYKFSLNPLWKYTKTKFSERFNTINSCDKDFTTSFASFLPAEILEKFSQAKNESEQCEENKIEVRRKFSFFTKRFVCTKYGIKISEWAKFSVRMLFTDDIKNVNKFLEASL